MSKANAALVLLSSGFVSSAKELRFLALEGGDYIFSLADGRLVAVDLVLGRVVRINGVPV